MTSTVGVTGRRDPAEHARSGVEAVAAAAVGAAVAAISWFRLSPTARGTIWAEDGAVFIADAVDFPVLTTLFRPYDGYLHLVPRLAGELVAALAPPVSYAYAMAALACLVAGAVASLVLVLARDVVPSVLVRVGLALVTAVVPALPVEVLGNMANVHWYFLWLTPWLLLHRPRSRRSGLLLGAVALVAGLTEAQVLYFLPLLVWRWRDRAYWPVRAGLLLGLAAQGFAYLIAPRPTRAGGLAETGDVLAGFVVNAVLTVWVGSTYEIADVVAVRGWAAALVPLTVIVGCLVLLLVRGTGIQRVCAITLAVGAYVAWAVPVAVNRRGDLDFSWPGVPAGPVPILRYAVVPSMFLLALVILGLAVLWSHGILARVLALLIATPLVVVAIANVHVDGLREGGPSWSAEVAAGRQVCAGSEVTDVRLAVAPQGWALSLPCRILLED